MTAALARTHLAGVVLAVALLAGFALRTIRLDSAPPGFFVDEALFGYDAYSILETGRDHHGNFLPITLVPLVAVLAIKPAVVRLGIALWGCADLVAMSLLAGLTLGLPGAAVAALLGAVSPWHQGYGRFAQEVMTAPATIDAAILCFFLWLRRKRNSWLMLSALLFGLSLYSYRSPKYSSPR
ncbi:MAG: hypothetical protein ACHQZS_01855 [Candidatus Binatales bacterium]